MLACGKVLGISLFESSLRSGVGILWPYAKLFSINYLWDIDFIKVAFIADDANNSLICANNIMYFFFIYKKNNLMYLGSSMAGVGGYFN
jgi:hypothetical protein